MNEFALTGMPALESVEGFDPDNPTRQTELLSLGLRKIFLTLAGDDANAVPGFVLSQPGTQESTDLSYAIESVDELGEAVSVYLANINGEPGLPAVPEMGNLLSVILPLVPAILSGGLSLTALIPVLLPTLIEGGLSIIFNRMSQAPSTGALQEIKEEIHRCFYNDSFDIPYAAYLNDIVDSFQEVAASLDSLDRLLQELEQARAIAIMHTSEIDKVVYIED